MEIFNLISILLMQKQKQTPPQMIHYIKMINLNHFLIKIINFILFKETNLI